MIREIKDRVTGALRRAKGRARLEALAAQSAPKTREEQELERLKVYLLEWATHQSRHRPKLSLPSHAPFANQPSSATSASEFYERSNGWAMQQIEASIDDLAELNHGMLMRAALRVRYLNEGVVPSGVLKIRVLRSGRLQDISLEEADTLADEAEKSLVSIVKRRGIPL